MSEQYSQREFDDIKKQSLDIIHKKDSLFKRTYIQALAENILSKTERTGNIEYDSISIRRRNTLWAKLESIIALQESEKLNDHVLSLVQLLHEIEGHATGNNNEEILTQSMKAQLELNKALVKQNIVREFSESIEVTIWNQVLLPQAKEGQSKMETAIKNLESLIASGTNIDDPLATPEIMELVHAHSDLMNTFYSPDNLKKRAKATAIQHFLSLNNFEGGQKIDLRTVNKKDLDTLMQCHQELVSASTDPLSYLELMRKNKIFTSAQAHLFPDLFLKDQLTRLSYVKPKLAQQMYMSISQEHARRYFNKGFVQGSVTTLEDMSKQLADIPGLVWEFSYEMGLKGNVIENAGDTLKQIAETNLAGKSLVEVWSMLNTVGKVAADSFVVNTLHGAAREQFLQDFSEDALVSACAQYLNWSTISEILKSITELPPQQQGELVGKIATQLSVGIVAQMGTSQIIAEFPVLSTVLTSKTFLKKVQTKIESDLRHFQPTSLDTLSKKTTVLDHKLPKETPDYSQFEALENKIYDTPVVTRPFRGDTYDPELHGNLEAVNFYHGSASGSLIGVASTKGLVPSGASIKVGGKLTPFSGELHQGVSPNGVNQKLVSLAHSRNGSADEYLYKSFNTEPWSPEKEIQSIKISEENIKNFTEDPKFGDWGKAQILMLNNKILISKHRLEEFSKLSTIEKSFITDPFPVKYGVQLFDREWGRFEIFDSLGIKFDKSYDPRNIPDFLLKKEAGLRGKARLGQEKEIPVIFTLDEKVPIVQKYLREQGITDVQVRPLEIGRRYQQYMFESGRVSIPDSPGMFRINLGTGNFTEVRLLDIDRKNGVIHFEQRMDDGSLYSGEVSADFLKKTQLLHAANSPSGIAYLLHELSPQEIEHLGAYPYKDIEVALEHLAKGTFSIGMLKKFPKQFGIREKVKLIYEQYNSPLLVPAKS